MSRTNSKQFGLVRDCYLKVDFLPLIGILIVRLRRVILACLLGLVTLSGCNDDKTDVSKERLESMSGGALKDVVTVKGVVNVDGKPTAGVNLYLYRESSPGVSILESQTDQDGKYCWSTYQSCDGLEPGSYLLGFSHIPKPKKDGTGIDVLNGKYQNAQKNKMELKVTAGSPQEGVNYDLVTK